MRDVEVAIPHFTLALLPDTAHFPIRLLQKVTDLGVTIVLVTLQLV